MKNLTAVLLCFACLMRAAVAAGNDRGPEQAQSYAAKAIVISGMAGGLDVDVSARGPVKLRLSGTPERVRQIHVLLDGTTLRIRDDAVRKQEDGWDWLRNVFRGRERQQIRNLQIHLTIPEKTPLMVDGFMGRARVGNTHSRLIFKMAGQGNAQIGDVGAAEIAIAGAGKVHVGQVAGAFSSAIAGSGTLRAGDISGGLTSRIAGSGHFFAASVHGSVKLKIAGSGNVRISGGEADPFHVKIAGQGDVRFNGVAHDPVIRAVGMARIQVKKYIGTLNESGNVNFSVGYMSLGKAPDGAW